MDFVRAAASSEWPPYRRATHAKMRNGAPTSGTLPFRGGRLRSHRGIAHGAKPERSHCFLHAGEVPFRMNAKLCLVMAAFMAAGVSARAADERVSLNQLPSAVKRTIEASKS